MKIGDVLTPHAAHLTQRDSDACLLSSCPERIEHWMSKHYVAKKLEGCSKLLYIEECCVSRCGRRRVITLAEDWDEVVVEMSIGSRRPDIVLLEGGVPIFAIEIHVTHAVDSDKRKDLAQMGIRFLEVKGQPSLYEGPDAWRGDRPLQGRYVSHGEAWRCDNCFATKAHDRRLSRCELVPVWVRAFENWHDDYNYWGDHHFVLVEHRLEDEVVSTSLWCGRNDRIAIAEGELTEPVRKRFRLEVEGRAQIMEDHGHSVQWIPWKKIEGETMDEAWSRIEAEAEDKEKARDLDAAARFALWNYGRGGGKLPSIGPSLLEMRRKKG